MKAIVIGSGIAGLAAAARMAARGIEVTVFETNETYGGKLGEIKENGFTFDWGPSLFTMPHFLEEIFTLAGKSLSDYFAYERLDEICRYFWEDGTTLIAPSSIEEFAKRAEVEFGVPREKIKNYLSASKRTYELTAPVFLEQSLHKTNNFLSKNVLKAFLSIPKLGLFTSLHQLNKSRLDEPHLVQIFDRYATYNGSDPYKTQGVMSSIAHLEFGVGAFFPKGGMRSIPKALFNLCQDLKVEFKFNTRVDEIVIKNGNAVGVRIGDRISNSDLVISNADAYFTYTKLLNKKGLSRKSVEQEKSTSALIFYWGIKSEFPQMGLHNIFFSKDYKEEFSHLTGLKRLYPDPTVYVNITIKMESKFAPEGCENWFTMINVPHIAGQDWDEIITTARKSIIGKLSRILKVDLEPLIISENIVDPRIIESKTGSHLGALYGSSSNSRYAAFLRPSNFSSSIKGLYFCGGSVHPGGGIPLCLLSAKIVDELTISATNAK